MIAARNNDNPEVLQILLNAGARIDYRDENGMTPLMFAARYNGNFEVIWILLNSGANKRIKTDKGKTAFEALK